MSSVLSRELILLTSSTEVEQVKPPVRRRGRPPKSSTQNLQAARSKRTSAAPTTKQTAKQKEKARKEDEKAQRVQQAEQLQRLPRPAPPPYNLQLPSLPPRGNITNRNLPIKLVSADHTLPKNDNERQHWTTVLVHAMRDVREAEDKVASTTDFVHVWLENAHAQTFGFDEVHMEQVCRKLVSVAEGLHRHGVGATEIFCPRTVKKVLEAKALTFQQRIECLAALMRKSKARCNDFMIGNTQEDTVALVADKLTAHRSNSKNNATRSVKYHQVAGIQQASNGVDHGTQASSASNAQPAQNTAGLDRDEHEQEGDAEEEGEDEDESDSFEEPEYKEESFGGDSDPSEDQPSLQDVSKHTELAEDDSEEDMPQAYGSDKVEGEGGSFKEDASHNLHLGPLFDDESLHNNQQGFSPVTSNPALLDGSILDREAAVINDNALLATAHPMLQDNHALPDNNSASHNGFNNNFSLNSFNEGFVPSGFSDDAFDASAPAAAWNPETGGENQLAMPMVPDSDQVVFDDYFDFDQYAADDSLGCKGLVAESVDDVESGASGPVNNDDNHAIEDRGRKRGRDDDNEYEHASPRKRIRLEQPEGEASSQANNNADHVKEDGGRKRGYDEENEYENTPRKKRPRVEKPGNGRVER